MQDQDGQNNNNKLCLIAFKLIGSIILYLIQCILEQQAACSEKFGRFQKKKLIQMLIDCSLDHITRWVMGHGERNKVIRQHYWQKQPIPGEQEEEMPLFHVMKASQGLLHLFLSQIIVIFLLYPTAQVKLAIF